MSKVNTLLKQWEWVTQKESHERRHSKMEITHIFTSRVKFQRVSIIWNDV